MTVVGVLIGFYAPHHLLPTMLSIEGRAVWATVVLLTVLAAPVAAFVYGVGSLQPGGLAPPRLRQE